MACRAHRASVWADHTIKGGPLVGFGIGAGVCYVGSNWADDTNTFRPPGVTLADAAIYYERGNYRFSVNAQNLFDKFYVSSCSGFDFCYYGLRRAVIGTLRYKLLFALRRAIVSALTCKYWRRLEKAAATGSRPGTAAGAIRPSAFGDALTLRRYFGVG
jgi:hypothetical protein